MEIFIPMFPKPTDRPTDRPTTNQPTNQSPTHPPNLLYPTHRCRFLKEEIFYLYDNSQKKNVNESIREREFCSIALKQNPTEIDHWWIQQYFYLLHERWHTWLYQQQAAKHHTNPAEQKETCTHINRHTYQHTTCTLTLNSPIHTQTETDTHMHTDRETQTTWQTHTDTHAHTDRYTHTQLQPDTHHRYLTALARLPLSFLLIRTFCRCGMLMMLHLWESWTTFAPGEIRHYLQVHHGILQRVALGSSEDT